MIGRDEPLLHQTDKLGLIIGPLHDARARRVAALPAGHPLTRRDELNCRDLAAEPTPAEHAYWSGQDHATVRNQPDVADPETAGPLVSDPSQLIEVVALGQAIALIPETLAEANPRTDIVYRPVTDATPYTVAIAWAEGSRGHHIGQFVHTATRLHHPHSVAS